MRTNNRMGATSTVLTIAQSRARTATAVLAAASVLAMGFVSAGAVQAASDVEAFSPQASGDVRQFWTPERMRAADGVEGNTLGRSEDRSAPVPSDVHGAHWEDGGLISQTAGRLFFLADDGDGPVASSCSANVVDSPNGSVIMTAGHCAYGTDYVFVPGYADGEAPHGMWTVDEVHRPAQVALDSDFAAFALDDLNGETVQDMVGAQGISFGEVTADDLWVFGFPRERTNEPDNPWGGEHLTYSEGPLIRDALGHVGTGSDMSSGVSGGPMLVDFDPATGIGTQVAAVSGAPCLVEGDDGSCEVAEETSNGVPFNDLAKKLYEQASQA